MTAPDFADDLTARAGGEDRTDADAAALDRALADSADARAELARMQAACAFLRGATPLPSAERRARALAPAPRPERPARRFRGIGWAAAAALLLAAGALWRAHEPAVDRIPPPGDRVPGVPGNATLGQQVPRDPDEVLRAAAKFAPFTAYRLPMAPAGLNFAKAVWQSAKTGTAPVDSLRIEYTGIGGEVVLVETVAVPAARAWLESDARSDPSACSIVEHGATLILIRLVRRPPVNLERLADMLMPLPPR